MGIGTIITIGFFLFVYWLIGIRIIKQYEQGVKFRLGKYVGIINPGLRWIIPIIETIKKIDLRIITIDVPSQEIMSADNVPVRINGVVFFKVVDPTKAVLAVEKYQYAITQLSQAALRDVCGKAELDSILTKREDMGNEIQTIVDKETDPWGIKITNVKIKDIELPDNMKRAMAHQAEAERDKRARIILATGEKLAASELLQAGKLIDSSPSALKLRLYQTLSDIATEKNSTIVFPFPQEMLSFISKNTKKSDKTNK